MTAVALHKPQTAPAIGADLMSDTSQFELAQRWANAFASSQLIPAHLRGKPADCLIAILMARQLKDNPLMVLQNIYIVSGKAGWSANYMIARANASGVFKGRITWDTKGAGDAMEVTAKAVLGDTFDLVTATATMQMAKAEGWTKNSKYQTMPEHMLRWRSATMLIRLYCPEVMMGMQTADEITDSAEPATAPRTVAASLDSFAAPESEPAHDPETGEIVDDVSADADASQDNADAEILESIRRVESCHTAADADAIQAAELERLKDLGIDGAERVIGAANAVRLRIQRDASPSTRRATR